MENDQSKFDLGQFLKEHKWHERKDALTKEQREEFGDYLEEKQNERKSTDLAEVDLATILMDGLSLVEREKTPAEADELLHRGILDDSPPKVKRAIRFGAKPNDALKGRTPLFWAVALKKHKALTALVENNADADASLVLDAFYRSDPKAALILASHCNNLETEKRIAPMTFQNYVHTPEGLEMGQLLIDRKIIRIDDVWIYYCSDPSRAERLTPFMIKNKGNMNHIIKIADGRFWTPLLAVVRTKNKKFIGQFLEAGANINLPGTPCGNSNEQTPLAFAVDNLKCESIAEFLIERGAKID